MNPQLFRKKPVTVEAVQWTGDNLEEIRKFLPKHTVRKSLFQSILISGWIVPEKDYIIKHSPIAFRNLRPDIFTATYEPVEGE